MNKLRRLVFEDQAWVQWQTFQKEFPKLAKKATIFIGQMRQEDPTVGLGKPEPLRYELSGLWSRRLDQKHRIVYSFDDKELVIWAIGGHY